MLLLNRNEKKWLRKKVQFLEQSGDTHILHVCLVRSTSPPWRRLQSIHAEKRKQQLLLLGTVTVLMRFLLSRWVPKIRLFSVNFSNKVPWLLRKEFSLLIRIPFTGVSECHSFDLLLYEEGKTFLRMHVLPESASSLLLLRERRATRSRVRFRGHSSRVSLESRTCIFPLFCRKPPSGVFQIKFIHLFIIYFFIFIRKSKFHYFEKQFQYHKAS